MLKYDRSEISGILITCTQCPHWFAFRFGQIAAYTAGEDHAIRVHDVPAERADHARTMYQQRIATRRR